MAYRDQRFIGVINADSIVDSNFIIGTGNFADGSTLIADVNISSGDEDLIRPGQIVFSVAGALPANTKVSSVNADRTQITLDKAATSTAAGDTFGLSTPSGSYFFQSASFNDPNNNLTVNNISGSDSGSSFAIVGVAKKSNATVKNRFHLYTVSEVVQRNIGSSEISFFVEWGEQGEESGSGDELQTAEKEVAIIDLTDTGSIAPGFSLGVAGMESLKAGSEYAGYNIAINQYLSDLSSSVASSLTGSLSGSVTGSLIGTATSASTAVLAQTASVATRANTLAPTATASRADSATTASFPERGVISGSVNQNVITLIRGDGATITLETSVSGSVESASIATVASTVRDGGSGSFSGSFQGDGSGLTGLVTASHALTAVSASFATSASVEIIKELSSSFADTASVAQSGTGSFSGSFTGSGEFESASFDDVLVKQYIAHKGDANTFINFTSNRIRLNAGGINFLSLEEEGSAPYPLTVNNGGNRINFRVVDRNSALLLKTDSEAFNVKLYYAGGKKFETVSKGVNVTGSIDVSGSIDVTGSVSASEDIVVSGNVFVDGTLDAATKNFRIQHPTLDGYYLIHSSLEGPERGIYYRGKLKTNNIIYLPDYWNELTDETDITVQLTPIGNACQHFVKSVSKREIEVGCDCGKPHCYYIVHAQRFNEGRLDILKPKESKRI
jgi:hypothetical protein